MPTIATLRDLMRRVRNNDVEGGEAVAPAWLGVKAMLSLFNADPASARRAYARFVADDVDVPEPSTYGVRSGFIGDEAFIKEWGQVLILAPFGKADQSARIRRFVTLA